MAGLKQGAWCHIEIPTANPEVAKKFFGSVFGWTFRDVPEMNYTLFSTGEGEIGGGLWNPAPGIPRQITNYIAVDEVDAMVARVQEHGGKLVNPKMQVPNAGWFALVADPDGNVFGIWQNLRPPAPEPGPGKSGANKAARKSAKRAAKKPAKKKAKAGKRR